MSKDRYRIIRPLGSGNFTVGVFLAEHLDLKRKVAVKLLAVGQPNSRASLLDEARKMASLELNENVVQVLDAGDWDADHVYIASEVCDGGSLESRCVQLGRPLDPGEACAFIASACRGLDFMHREGLLHLDIRPANILIGAGIAKLADFGLARWVTDSTVPQVYAPHAAPEMLRDYKGSPASDQYAMGMTLAHLLTAGAACETPPTPVTKAAWDCYPPLSRAIGVNVPDSLRRVMAKSTSFEALQRYGSVEGFKRAVDRATPAVSFRMNGIECMESSDGVWSIGWHERRSDWTVDVRRNGRRVSAHSARELSAAGALRHVRRIVTSLARG